jgi:hypothetical protein
LGYHTLHQQSTRTSFFVNGMLMYLIFSLFRLPFHLSSQVQGEAAKKPKAPREVMTRLWRHALRGRPRRHRQKQADHGQEETRSWCSVEEIKTTHPQRRPARRAPHTPVPCLPRRQHVLRQMRRICTLSSSSPMRRQRALASTKTTSTAPRRTEGSRTRCTCIPRQPWTTRRRLQLQWCLLP